jgi:hypothetical protein
MRELNHFETIYFFEQCTGFFPTQQAPFFPSFSSIILSSADSVNG